MFTHSNRHCCCECSSHHCAQWTLHIIVRREFAACSHSPPVYNHFDVISWHVCINVHSCGSSNSSSAKSNVSHAYLQASMRAILNANYMAKRLEQSYPVLYKGKNGTCAHEFILDIRSLKESAGILFVATAEKLFHGECDHHVLR